MNRKQKIEQEIEKTLEQFEQAERLPGNPYFYTRVQARLDESEPAKRKTLIPAVLKPVFLGLLVSLNVLTAVYFLSGNSTQTADRSDLLSEFAREYGLEENDNELFIIQ